MGIVELRSMYLTEIIFEFRWKLLGFDSQEIEEDPHYALLVGRFSEKAENDYPFYEPLPSSKAPSALVPFIPQHRFRTSKDEWPVIQIGPGVMTVNAVRMYDWKDFSQRCVRAVENLFDAHPKRDVIETHDVSLRYICAKEADQDNVNILNFAQNDLRLTLRLPDSLFEPNQVNNTPNSFNWVVSFPTLDTIGKVSLKIALGTLEGRPAYVWEISTQTSQAHVPALPSDCSEWLEKAHDLTDDWFFKTLKT